jgi:hypothetical protein
MKYYTTALFMRDILKPQSGTQSGTFVSPVKNQKNHDFLARGRIELFTKILSTVWYFQAK